MIVILGDIHFDDSKSWKNKVCTDFLNWFKKWKFNTPENTLLLAGDLVENNLLTGKVADYLYKFYSYSKFKEIHICAGNHDIKKVKTVSQLAYEFYKNKKNIHIYEQPAEVQIEGLSVLFLPYYMGPNEHGFFMNEYYSNLYKNPMFKGHYDLVIGHFSGPDFSFQGSTDVVQNLDKLNPGKICLGHIHTRGLNPDMYIGSVFAGKKNENDFTRAAWYYDNGWKEDPLPIFNEFLTVCYPDDLPKSKAMTPVYTILNCGDEQIALEKYGPIEIRRFTSEGTEMVSKTMGDFEEDFQTVKNMELPKLFETFISLQENLPADVINECKGALGIA